MTDSSASESSAAGPGEPTGQTQASDPSIVDVLRQNLNDRNSIIDSSLPTAAFLVAYLVSGSQLTPAIWWAVGAGCLVAVFRVLRKESVQHVLSGFLGVAIAAFIASRTGRAEDFFLPGLLLNVAYTAAFAVSAVVRRPLVGLGIAVMTGDRSGWREDADVRRAAMAATWVWAAVFGLRVLVQLPLYLIGSVAILGVAKLVLGFPLFALGVLITYRLLAPALARRRRRAQEEAERASLSCGSCGTCPSASLAAAGDAVCASTLQSDRDQDGSGPGPGA